MATLRQHLSSAARDWLTTNSAQLTPDGEIELEALLGTAALLATARPEFAGGNIPPTGDPGLVEAETNLGRILAAARQIKSSNPIDAIALQQARLSLCPLFPFC